MNQFGSVKQCPVRNRETAFYKVANRKRYSCERCGHNIEPTANTIFHKSPTPLKDWFYAIYLFSVSKDGVSAKELERQLGATYKSTYRMAQRRRVLFDGDIDLLKPSSKLTKLITEAKRKTGMRAKEQLAVKLFLQKQNSYCWQDKQKR